MINGDEIRTTQIKLPDLTPVPGLVLVHPLALIPQEDQQRVRDGLEELARLHRNSEAQTGSLRLG